MAIGGPTKALNVTAEEREKLSMLAHRPKSAQALAMRARIVLACHGGASNAAEPSGSGSREQRSANGGNDFVWDVWKGCSMNRRPGAPRSISDSQIEEVITNTLESMPANSTHWSTRLMAQRTGL